MDEPESLGAISLAARERLDNLVFVVNCNLQRLDGPVRGNGKIIQELEAVFRGAGWNVIKVIWGSYWDPLLARDTNGLLLKRMEECVDGDYQAYKAKGGAYTREHFFGKYPELADMVANLTDEDIWRLNRGGHDPIKVYAAYAAGHARQGPADGDPGQDRQGLRHGRGRRGHEHHPLAEEDGRGQPQGLPRPLQHPDLRRPDRRRALLQAAAGQPGDEVPARAPRGPRRPLPARKTDAPAGGARPLDAFKRCWRHQRRARDVHHHGLGAAADHAHPRQGDRQAVVPIVPDEARTFGMEGMFRQLGIYSHVGQLYEPVDSDQVMYYREEKTARSCRRASTRPAPCRPGSPPPPPTPTTARR
jgi:pyruvate dehydrogenase E1 component